jgi:hypothetical protein
MLISLLAVTLVACGGVASVSAGALASDDALASSNAAAADGLSAEEAEGILYMREEEKLARDVYRTLYEQWGLPVFQNIANSEQAHMEAIKTLIDRYGLDDPVADHDVSEFSNPTLQSLYDELTASGRESLAAALRVGTTIEEIDIIDLEEYLSQTDEADIARVYENLMRGSRNHLRAFVSALGRQEGETYAPQYLDQETYEEIVGAYVEPRGNGSGRQGQDAENGGGQQGKGQGGRDGSGRSGSSQGGRGGSRW